jgi:hypothetical protein
MNDDLFLLASAYLDGELSADERVRVESDPEVLALVDRLRAVASDIAAVDPPAAARRDATFLAALAAFDEMSAADAPARTGAPDRSVVPMPARRPVAARWLSVAAAVLVVGVLGTVAIGALSGRTSDDTGGDVSDVASPMSVDDDASSMRSDAELESALAPDAEGGRASDDMAADGDALMGSPEDAPDADMGIAADVATMRTPADLALIAQELLVVAAATDHDGSVQADSPCPGTGDIIGVGIYRDRSVYVTVGADPVEPVEPVDAGTIIASAVDTVTCAIAAQTALDPAD